MYCCVRSWATRGQIFTESQVDGMRAVAVLGGNVAEDLFGLATPVGKTMRIKGQTFQVIGVLEKKGGSGFGSVDDQLFVPLGVAQLKLFGARSADTSSPRISSVSIQVADAAQIDAVSAAIGAIMRKQHRLKADGSAR